jgi:hypothetical protein
MLLHIFRAGSGAMSKAAQKKATEKQEPRGSGMRVNIRGDPTSLLGSGDCP